MQRMTPERKSITIDLTNWKHLVLIGLMTLGGAKAVETVSSWINTGTGSDAGAPANITKQPNQPIIINLEFNAPPLATGTPFAEVTQEATDEVTTEATEEATVEATQQATALILEMPSPAPATEAIEVIPTAAPNLPDESADEDASLGFHNEGELLNSPENLQALIFQTLLDLENHPELRDRILANQRWMDDLLNPTFTNWQDRDLLERDFRGLAFSPEILIAAAGQHENWYSLFTEDSIARAEDPDFVDSSRVLFQFAVDPIALAREGQLNIGVPADGAEYYFVDYSNIANIQTVLYAAAVDALVASGVDASDATIREAATIYANSWRQFHGLTNAAGLTNVDTNGGQTGGIVQFRHGPFLRVCEVYQMPAVSNDPLDQRETTRIVDVLPLINLPETLTTDINWGSAQSNERGRYVTALRIGQISGERNDANSLAQELLLASAQTTWNNTDNYQNTSGYETELNSVFFTFLPCDEPAPVIQPTPVPVTEVTPPPQNQTCEELGNCDEPDCEDRGDCETPTPTPTPEKQDNGETNPDGTLPEEMPTEAPTDDTTEEEANDGPEGL